ncbi:spike protein [Serpentovirales sp.]|nr:spike protein [Serpentovirales sp.]
MLLLLQLSLLLLYTSAQQQQYYYSNWDKYLDGSNAFVFKSIRNDKDMIYMLQHDLSFVPGVSTLWPNVQKWLEDFLIVGGYVDPSVSATCRRPFPASQPREIHKLQCGNGQGLTLQSYQKNIDNSQLITLTASTMGVVDFNGTLYLDPTKQLLTRVYFKDGKYVPKQSGQCPIYSGAKVATVPFKQKVGRDQYEDSFRAVVVQQQQLRQNYIKVDPNRYVYTKSIQKVQSYDKGKFQDCNDTFIVYRSHLKNSESYYAQDSIDFGLHSLDLQCRCNTTCTLFFSADVRVAIADSRVLESPISITDARRVAIDLDLYYQSLQSPEYQKYKGLEARQYYKKVEGMYQQVRGKYQTYNFNSRLYLLFMGVPAVDSIPYIYCSVRKEQRPVTPTFREQVPLRYLPQVITLPDLTQVVLFDRQDNISDYRIGVSPQFVSGSVTKYPTKGSCLAVEGYRWAGSFEVVQPSSIAYCNEPDSTPLEVCFSQDLEVSYMTFTIPRKVFIPSDLTCDVVCYNRPCTQTERRSAIYAACQQLLDAINILGGVIQQPGSAFERDYVIEEKVTQPIIRFFQEVEHELDAISIKTIPTMNFAKLKTWLPYGAAFNNADEIAELLPPIPIPWGGLLGGDASSGQAMWNTAADMNAVAALPWLSGWKFGRQINLLSLSTKTIIQSLDGIVNGVNTNFQVIEKAVRQQVSQVVNNYKSITNLWENVKQVTSLLEQEILSITQRLDRVEYGVAKLSQMQALYSQVLVAHSRLKTDFQLQNLREVQCRNNYLTCTDGNAIPLSFQRLLTRDYDIIAVKVLKPKNCQKVFETAYYCHQGKAYLSPFPCVFFYNATAVRGNVLPSKTQYQLINKTDDTLCLEKPFVFSDCNFTDVVAQKYQIYNFLARDIAKPNNTINRIKFEEQIDNITVFKTTVDSVLSNLKAINISEFDVKLSAPEAYQIVANKWTWWDYVRLGFYIILASLFAAILLPILNCFKAIFCCNK